MAFLLTKMLVRVVFYSGLLCIISTSIVLSSVDVQSIDVPPAVEELLQFEAGVATTRLHNLAYGAAATAASGFARGAGGGVGSNGGAGAGPGQPEQRQESLGQDDKSLRQLAPDVSEPQLDISFMHAFVASMSIIIVSELGDKTFFICAIMSMSHPRMTVFAGAMTALAGMHVLSALFGFVITFVPRVYTFHASTFLFVVFGIKMLRQGWRMSADEGKEELEEVQSDLRDREDSYDREPLEEGGRGLLRRSRVLGFVSRVFLQAFTLNVLAEWGDRSQIAAVLMAAREDIYGVIVGGLLGHFFCTGLAVLGGRVIAMWISVRTVTLIGGLVFLVFAASALIIGP